MTERTGDATEAAIQQVMRSENLTRDQAIQSIMGEGFLLKAARIKGQIIVRTPNGDEAITDENGQFPWDKDE